MNDSIAEFLRARITEIKPQSLLVVGIERREFATVENLPLEFEVNYLQANEITTDDNHYDLGVILFGEYTQECWSVLSRSRDVLTRCLIVIVPNAYDRPASDIVALGMTKIDLADIIGYSIYEYDVATYKSTPDWLSSNSWANPGQWEKERW